MKHLGLIAAIGYFWLGGAIALNIYHPDIFLTATAYITAGFFLLSRWIDSL